LYLLSFDHYQSRLCNRQEILFCPCQRLSDLITAAAESSLHIVGLPSHHPGLPKSVAPDSSQKHSRLSLPAFHSKVHLLKCFLPAPHRRADLPFPHWSCQLPYEFYHQHPHLPLLCSSLFLPYSSEASVETSSCLSVCKPYSVLLSLYL
jgi:hypothetical protein